MKNIVITGSTRGLGFAMATEFLRAGCNVTLSGRGEKLEETAQRELSPFEGKYIYVSCNLNSRNL
ncbi:hypothetical protein B0533_10895 [Sedimentibacter sp. SX930]|nr:hypothetical protein B0533_10895 [Sedimentibacter sp. SX930]